MNGGLGIFPQVNITIAILAMNTGKQMVRYGRFLDIVGVSE